MPLSGEVRRLKPEQQKKHLLILLVFQIVSPVSRSRTTMVVLVRVCYVMFGMISIPFIKLIPCVHVLQSKKTEKLFRLISFRPKFSMTMQVRIP